MKRTKTEFTTIELYAGNNHFQFRSDRTFISVTNLEGVRSVVIPTKDITEVIRFFLEVEKELDS